MCAGGASADPGGASFSGYRGGQRESSGVVSQGSRSARAWHHPSQTLRGVLLEKKPSCCCPCPINPTKHLSGNNAPCIGDCHLILDKCYYSVPYPYRGEKLWVRADLKLVRVYRNHQLIKTHVRVFEPGTWQTQTADYPPDKRIYLEQTPE